MLLFGSVCVSSGEEIKNVVAASEEWEKGTNADGSGFYWELLDLIYGAKGIKVDKNVMPYERAVNMVKAGKADLWVGSYANEEEFPIYPQYPMDADIVAAVYKKDKIDLSKGQEALKDKKVGWIRGYSYDSYLDVPVKVTKLDGRASGIKMVIADRLDAFLDAKHDIELELQKGEIDRSGIDVKEILQLKLYMAFANNDKGRELAQIWDSRLKELHDSGELKKFYDKYGYARYYPF